MKKTSLVFGLITLLSVVTIASALTGYNGYVSGKVFYKNSNGTRQDIWSKTVLFRKLPDGSLVERKIAYGHPLFEFKNLKENSNYHLNTFSAMCEYRSQYLGHRVHLLKSVDFYLAKTKYLDVEIPFATWNNCLNACNTSP